VTKVCARGIRYALCESKVAEVSQSVPEVYPRLVRYTSDW
jgi:hypothetical protein